MARMTRWMGWMAVAVMLAGCGRKEAQVVTPRPAHATDVAIWVDNASITHGELQREASRLFGNIAANVPPEQVPAAQAQVLRQAVDNLVVRALVRGEMERSGVTISRDELEAGKRDLERGLGPDHSLAILLATANLTMEELERNLVLDLFKNKMLKDRLDAALEGVNEAAARTYYEENIGNFKTPAGRLTSHVLIRVPEEADEAVRTAARARAEGIRQALLEGADFAALARETSQCASRARGGDLGVVPRGREAPAFEEAVFSQEFGAIGEVVESPVGFHVIQVRGEQEEGVTPFDEVSERLQMMLRSRIQQELTVEYIDTLRDKATIKLEGFLAEMAAPVEGPESPAPESVP